VAKRTKIEQAIADRKKIVRTVIRLKHSIEADHAINEVLDDNIKALTKALQQGQLPAPPNLGELLKLDTVLDTDGE
jgi:hypothetical protein